MAGTVTRFPSVFAGSSQKLGVTNLDAKTASLKALGSEKEDLGFGTELTPGLSAFLTNNNLSTSYSPLRWHGSSQNKVDGGFAKPELGCLGCRTTWVGGSKSPTTECGILYDIVLKACICTCTSVRAYVYIIYIYIYIYGAVSPCR